MSKKPICFDFYIAVWGARIWVLAGAPLDDLEAKYRFRMFKEKISGPASPLEAGEGEGAIFWDERLKGGGIGFRDRSPEPGCLVHECFHMTYRILRISGVRLSLESEESFAYLLDHIVTEVTEGLKKRR